MSLHLSTQEETESSCNLSDAMKSIFVQFLNQNIDAEEFIKWLYSKSDISNYIGEDYQALCVINYEDTLARAEVRKIMHLYLDLADIEEKRIREALNALVMESQCSTKYLKIFDELYKKGFTIFQPLSFIYGFDLLSSLPPFANSTEEEEIKRLYPIIKSAATRLLCKLDNEQLIVGYNLQYNDFTYEYEGSIIRLYE